MFRMSWPHDNVRDRLPILLGSWIFSEISDVIMIYVIYSENTDLTMTSETSEKKKTAEFAKKLNILKTGR